MAESITDIKIGRIVRIGNDPCLVVSSAFLRKQQRKPVMKTKLKNLITGGTIEKSFLAGESFEFVDVQNVKCQYLYKDNDSAYFMDYNTYEQFSIPLDMLEEQLKFMLDGCEVNVSMYEGRPIGVELPNKVVLKVTDTPPGVKGDSQSGGGKPATLETGAVVTVPLFINIGDSIRVNTETQEYVERAEKG